MRAGLVAVAVAMAVPGAAHAYACPDGFVPSVGVGILRGTQVVRAGAQVPMRADTGDCKYSSAIPAANLEITVAAHPNGPFTPLAGVRRFRDRFVWTPRAAGVYYVRVTLPGRPRARLIPAQLAFVVTDRGSTARVELQLPTTPRVRYRSHLLLTAQLPALAGRDDWDPPILGIRARPGPRQRIVAHLVPGRWLVTRGLQSYEKHVDMVGPGALWQVPFERFGEITVTGDGPIVLPPPEPIRRDP